MIVGVYLNLWTPLFATQLDSYRAWYNSKPELHPDCPELSMCDTPSVFLMSAVPTFFLLSLILILYFCLLPIPYPNEFQLTPWNIKNRWRSFWTLIMPALFLLGPVSDILSGPVYELKVIGLIAFVFLFIPFLIHRSLLLSKQ